MESNCDIGSRRAKILISAVSIIAFLIVLTAIPTSAEDVYKGDLIVESKMDVRYGTSESVNVTLSNYTGNLNAFQIKLRFDPMVASYINWVKTMDDGDVDQYKITTGVGVLTVQFIDSTPSTWTNPTLFRVIFRANTSDGSSTFINVSTTELEIYEKPDPATTNTIHPNITNGTFKTLDEVPPTITFDVSESATIPGPDIKVNATLYDLSGINESSIVVKLNETPIDNYTITQISDTTWNVTIHPNITYYGFELNTQIQINVSARDNSTMQNLNYSTVNVTVAETGFFDLKPIGYINTTDITISARFVNIDNTTVKMYLDGVDVTTRCIIGEDIIEYQATGLSEGEHKVLVNGTIVGDTREKSATWNFTVDITPPQIIYFSVSDSDGDGFNESGETLTISWNVSDPNFDRIEIIDLTHSITSDSSNSSIEWTSTYGNQEVKFKAVDKADNVNEITFHVYNNYVAYITSSKSLSFGGIDLNKTAVMDLMNLSISKVEFFGGKNIILPNVSQINRTFIVDGKLPLDTTVRLDRNANATITDTYRYLTVYEKDANLSFKITAPSVTKANVILVQLNSSKVDEFLNGKPLNLTTLRKLFADIMDNKTEYVGYVYFFGPGGWAKAKINPDGSIKSSVSVHGSFYINKNSLYDTLNNNTVDLSQGFTPNFTAKNLSLTAGEYVLFAFSLDADRVGLIATMPLVVVNSTETGTVPNTVKKGEPLSVSFSDAEHVVVFMVRNVSYSIKAELNVSSNDIFIGKLNFTSTGASQTSESLQYTYGGKTYDLNVSFPTGYAALNLSAGNSVSIDTSNLAAGDYILYAISEKDKRVEAIGVHTVTVLEAKPDLNITSVSYSPVSPIAGQQVTINLTISNNGNADAKAFNVSMFVNGTKVADQRLEGLNVSSSQLITFKWTPTAAGTYEIKIVVDPENAVDESNETNNEVSFTISVTPSPTPTPTPTPKPGPAMGGAGGGGYIPGTGVFHTPLEIVKAGESYEILMPQSFMIETGIVSVTVKPEENTNVRVRTERLKELPAGIPEPEGMIAAWSISLTLSKETSASGKIKFRISIEEIRAKGFDPNLIALILMKWDGSRWLELPTSYVSSDGKYNYYEAETSSFSYFVAVSKTVQDVTPTPATTATLTPAETPTVTATPSEKSFITGFEAIFAAAGIIAAAYLLRRKN